MVFYVIFGFGSLCPFLAVGWIVTPWDYVGVVMAGKYCTGRCSNRDCLWIRGSPFTNPDNAGRTEKISPPDGCLAADILFPESIPGIMDEIVNTPEQV